MATLQTRLTDLATRVATECKSIRNLINGNAADNTALITAAKGNLVAAINEVKAQANALQAAAGATINDGASTSTTQTYSIDKIHAELANTAAQVQAAILGGADAAYDTLKELQDLLTGEQNQLNNLLSALGSRVRTDTASQGLSTVEKQNARTNIDAYGSTELGNPDTNLVTAFEAGLLS